MLGPRLHSFRHPGNEEACPTKNPSLLSAKIQSAKTRGNLGAFSPSHSLIPPIAPPPPQETSPQDVGGAEDLSKKSSNPPYPTAWNTKRKDT